MLTERQIIIAVILAEGRPRMTNDGEQKNDVNGGYASDMSFSVGQKTQYLPKSIFKIIFKFISRNYFLEVQPYPVGTVL